MALVRIRKLILFPPEMVEMVEKYQEEKMLPSFTVTIIQLILIAFEKINADKGEDITEEKKV